MKPTLYVNLYGASGSGKSTLAAEVFALLKHHSIVAELVREAVKDLAWEGRRPSVVGQFWIAAEQLRRERALDGKVDVVVTDGPWALAHYYGLEYDPDGWHPDIYNAFLAMTRGRLELNVWVNRTKPYVQAGRYGSEDTAQKDAQKIRALLGHRMHLETNSQGAADILRAVYDRLEGRL